MKKTNNEPTPEEVENLKTENAALKKRCEEIESDYNERIKLLVAQRGALRERCEEAITLLSVMGSYAEEHFSFTRKKDREWLDKTKAFLGSDEITSFLNSAKEGK